MRGVVLSTILIALLISVGVVMALPTGPGTFSAGTPERRGTPDAEQDNAYAGNTTRLTIDGETITRAWQGYYGNVTGSITLDNAANQTLYNWTLNNPEGEVYAANKTVTWTNIQCFNFTANGTFNDDSAQAGATSIWGMNLSQLEAAFNIAWDDEDGVNETFDAATTHDAFYTDNDEFTSGECLAVNLFNESEESNSAQFQEALLYDPDGQTPVFASILETGSVTGFNDEDLDFEMIVLEDGHNSDVSATTYYFYVELE
jgi:hypothetical protein